MGLLLERGHRPCSELNNKSEARTFQWNSFRSASIPKSLVLLISIGILFGFGPFVDGKFKFKVIYFCAFRMLG